jgi:uncharacterized protein YodC (DUF2158 family)
MTLFSNPVNGTNGVQPVTGAGADDWDAVTVSGGATLTYSNTEAVSGGSSMYVDSPSTSGIAYCRWDDGAAFTQLATRMYIMLPTLPSASTTFFQVQQTTSSLRTIGISIASDGRLVATDSAGAATWHSNGVLSTDIWYRIEIRMDRGVGTTWVETYQGHSSTMLADQSFTATGMAMTTASQRVAFGKYSGTSICGYYVDDCVAQSGTLTAIGPLPIPTASYTLTGVYPANSSLLTSWTVNSAASVGTATLTQLSGTTATVTGSHPTFTITNPTGSDDLLFRLDATSGSSTDSATFTLQRGSGAAPTGNKQRYTFQGGTVSDTGNWR